MLIASVVVGMTVVALGGGVEVGEPRRFEFTQLAMGDRARIVLYATDEDHARAAAKAAFIRIDELERVMSDYRGESEVMMLATRGAEGSTGARVSEDLFGVLLRAKEVAAATGGAFDPTMGPVVRLWRDARRTGRMPDEDARAAALAAVGHERLVIDERTRTVRLTAPGMRIDLGGIGKGYGADAAAEVLKGAGVRSYLVALGGDIVTGAAPPGEEGWRITVGPGEGQDVLVEWAAVSTSGDSEQFVEIDGVRYSHIVDPRTGLGVVGAPRVTIVAASGTLADATATALSVLGGEALETAKRLGVEARLDPPQGEPRLTDGFPRARGAPFRGPGPAKPNTPPPGFRALFNGRDLTGWTGVAADPPDLIRMTPEERAAAEATAAAEAPTHWTVEDGVLRFDGSWMSLRTVEEFGDVELLVDWKIAPGGDSGIYLRGCPQVQIWDNAVGSGGLYNNQKKGSQPRHIADRPPGEWNTFRIVMVGDEVTAYLNGQLVVDRAPLEHYWDRTAPLPARGPIWLQAHGTPLWFRSVFIRELDAGPASSAPAAGEGVEPGGEER